MDPRSAYRQSYSPGWTRVDMLLALFDGAIERLELAAPALRGGDLAASSRLLTRVQLIVCELAGGVDPNFLYAEDFLRMYGLAARAVGEGTPEGAEVAVRVLRTLRESVAAVREEAVALEKQGALPSADAVRLVHLTA